MYVSLVFVTWNVNVMEEFQKNILTATLFLCFSQTLSAEILSSPLKEPGTYNDTSIEINSSGQAEGISLSGSSMSDDVKTITIQGDLYVAATGNQSHAIRIEDGFKGSAQLYVTGNANIKAESRNKIGWVNGIEMGSSYSHGLGHDGLPNNGCVTIDGSVNLDIRNGTMGSGIFAGSWFGNSGSSDTGGKILIGKEGLQNTINVDLGQVEPTNSNWQDNKVIGVLAHGAGVGTAQVILRGDTNIFVNNSMRYKPDNINIFTAGVVAAKQSNIMLLNPNGNLGITVSAGETKRLQFGLMAGLYDFSDKKSHSDIIINQKKTDIHFINGADVKAVAAYSGSNINIDSDLSITASNVDSIIGLHASNYVSPIASLENSKGGNISITGGYSMYLPEGMSVTNYKLKAIFADGKNNSIAPIVTVDGKGASSQINGGIYARHGGLISLDLDGSNSYIKGHIDQRSNHSTGTWSDLNENGEINLKLNNGSIWYNTDVLLNVDNFGDSRSALNSLTLNHGTVDMSTLEFENGQQYSQYQKIMVKTLDTLNGSIVFDMNLSDEITQGHDDLHRENTDQLIIQNAAKGSLAATIHFQSGDQVSPDKKHSINWIVSQGENSDLTITDKSGTNHFSGRGMLSDWQLVFVADGDEKRLEDSEFREKLSNTGKGKGNWYLVRSEGEPLIPLLPSEAIDQVDLGSALALAASWYAEESDLRERLGEVRYGTPSGSWAKLDTRKEKFSNIFEQKSDGIHVGYDTLVNTSEISTWLIGGALRYSESNQDRLGQFGSGETIQYSAKIYGTWMNRAGCYADLVAQVGHYKQSIEGLDNTRTGEAHAKYSTNGIGLSAEIGHAFAFGSDTDDRPWHNHIFIEPQLQLSYFHSSSTDYTSTTGLSVRQAGGDFLTGRAGIVLGKKFSFGGLNSLDKRYVQLELKTGVEHEFKGSQSIYLTGLDGVSVSRTVDDLFGDRYYYGMNLNGQITDTTRLYGSFEYIEGDEYRQDYSFTVGVKHQF